MRKHQESGKINEGVVEKTLLDNIFNLNARKYKSVSDIEKHFLKDLSLLIKKGEIKKSSVMEYLEEMGIEFDFDKDDEQVGDDRIRYFRSNC